MPSSNQWMVVNISLAILSLILVLTFFEVEIPNLGQVRYLANPQEPLCVINYQNDYTKMENQDFCCHWARQQLQCDRIEREWSNQILTRDCHTGTGKVVHYLLNEKTYEYCFP